MPIKKRQIRRRRIKRRGGAIEKITDLLSDIFFKDYNYVYDEQSNTGVINGKYFFTFQEDGIPSQTKNQLDDEYKLFVKIYTEVFNNYKQKYIDIYNSLKKFKELLTTNVNYDIDELKRIFKNLFPDDNNNVDSLSTEREICDLLEKTYVNFIKSIQTYITRKNVKIFGIAMGGVITKNADYNLLENNFEQNKDILKVDDNIFKKEKERKIVVIKKESTEKKTDEEEINELFAKYKKSVQNTDIKSEDWLKVQNTVFESIRTYQEYILRNYDFVKENGEYKIVIKTKSSDANIKNIKNILESIIFKKYYTMYEEKNKTRQKYDKIIEDFINNKLKELKARAQLIGKNGLPLYYDDKKERPRYDKREIEKFLIDQLETNQRAIVKIKPKSLKELEELTLILLTFVKILKTNKQLPRPDNFPDDSEVQNPIGNGMPPLPPRGPPLPPLPPRGGPLLPTGTEGQPQPPPQSQEGRRVGPPPPPPPPPQSQEGRRVGPPPPPPQSQDGRGPPQSPRATTTVSQPSSQNGLPLPGAAVQKYSQNIEEGVGMATDSLSMIGKFTQQTAKGVSDVIQSIIYPSSAGDSISSIPVNVGPSVTSQPFSRDSFKSLMISDEIIINKKYILKSLKYYIYLLILNSYENNKSIYYTLLRELISKLFPTDEIMGQKIVAGNGIYKIMLDTSKLYKKFIEECSKINSRTAKKIDESTQQFKTFDKFFRILLHCMFWTNYIQADNMYALSCIQVFVLLFDDKILNIFNYINLIFHLSSDLTSIYETLRNHNRSSTAPLIGISPPSSSTSSKSDELLSTYLNQIKELLKKDGLKDADLIIDDDDVNRRDKIDQLFDKLDALTKIPTDDTEPEKTHKIKTDIKKIINHLVKLLKRSNLDSKFLDVLNQFNDRIPNIESTSGPLTKDKIKEIMTQFQKKFEGDMGTNGKQLLSEHDKIISIAYRERLYTAIDKILSINEAVAAAAPQDTTELYELRRENEQLKQFKAKLIAADNQGVPDDKKGSNDDILEFLKKRKKGYDDFERELGKLHEYFRDSSDDGLKQLLLNGDVQQKIDDFKNNNLDERKTKINEIIKKIIKLYNKQIGYLAEQLASSDIDKCKDLKEKIKAIYKQLKGSDTDYDTGNMNRNVSFIIPRIKKIINENDKLLEKNKELQDSILPIQQELERLHRELDDCIKLKTDVGNAIDTINGRNPDDIFDIEMYYAQSFKNFIQLLKQQQEEKLRRIKEKIAKFNLLRHENEYVYEFTDQSTGTVKYYPLFTYMGEDEDIDDSYKTYYILDLDYGGDLDVSIIDENRSLFRLLTDDEKSKIVPTKTIKALHNKLKEINKFHTRDDIKFDLGDGKNIYLPVFTKSESDTDYYVFNINYDDSADDDGGITLKKEPLFIPYLEYNAKYGKSGIIKQSKCSEKTEKLKRLEQKIQQINSKFFRHDKYLDYEGKQIPVFNDINDSNPDNYYIFYFDNPAEPNISIKNKQLIDTDRHINLFVQIDGNLKNYIRDHAVPVSNSSTSSSVFYSAPLAPPSTTMYTVQPNLNGIRGVPQPPPQHGPVYTSYTQPIGPPQPVYQQFSPQYYRGGGPNEDNITLIASIYSNFLNITSSPNASTIQQKELDDYKTKVDKDCSNKTVSDDYIKAILDLHQTSFSLTNKLTNSENIVLSQKVALQLNLLSTVNINKCGLYNFIDYCYDNKDKQIYTLERKRYITQIKRKHRVGESYYKSKSTETGKA